MPEITLQDKKVLTPKFRVSFPKLDKPHSFKGGEPKFEIVMLFDKSTDLKSPVTSKDGKPMGSGISMWQAVQNACIDRWGEDRNRWPAKKTKTGKTVSAIRLPFRDGDREKPDQTGYQNTIFCRAWSKADNPPGFVDQNRQPIDAKMIYAGCYARAVLIAFAYGDLKSGIPPGVGFSLQHVQKIGDGEKFGGKRSAMDEFDVVEDESDLPEHYPGEGEQDLESAEVSEEEELAG